jgi:hypothetical protein
MLLDIFHLQIQQSKEFLKNLQILDYTWFK